MKAAFAVVGVLLLLAAAAAPSVAEADVRCPRSQQRNLARGAIELRRPFMLSLLAAAATPDHALTTLPTHPNRACSQQVEELVTQVAGLEAQLKSAKADAAIAQKKLDSLEVRPTPLIAACVVAPTLMRCIRHVEVCGGM